MSDFHIATNPQTVKNSRLLKRRAVDILRANEMAEAQTKLFDLLESVSIGNVLGNDTLTLVMVYMYNQGQLDGLAIAQREAQIEQAKRTRREEARQTEMEF